MKINKSLKEREREREKGKRAIQSVNLENSWRSLTVYGVCVCVCVCVGARACVCVCKMGRIAAWLCVDEHSQQKGEETDAVGETEDLMDVGQQGARGTEGSRPSGGRGLRCTLQAST